MNTAWMKHGVVVLFLAAASSAVDVRGQRVPLNDEGIKAQVESQLFDAGLIGVQVAVQHRAVILRGEVASLWLRDQATKQARKVPGVAKVITELTVRPRSEDSSVAQEIADEIGGSSSFSIFDNVDIHVAEGVATLTGQVTTADKSRDFTKATSRVAGVRQIVNRIETLPTSMSDDDLRYAIAGAIYGDAAFSAYGSQRAGPVHIIVRRGHVTLVGVVGSEVERRMAEMLAREAFGVMGVDNQLRLEE